MSGISDSIFSAANSNIPVSFKIVLAISGDVYFCACLFLKMFDLITAWRYF
jgi:mannose/fructose/N-acetylgalactosamine-specific phosphotransferase system component IID